MDKFKVIAKEYYIMVKHGDKFVMIPCNMMGVVVEAFNIATHIGEGKYNRKSLVVFNDGICKKR